MDANEKFSMKEYKRNYYLKNREKIRQKVKEKMKTPEFKEKRKKYLEKYYEENKEYVISKSKEYYKNNIEKKKSYDKKYSYKRWALRLLQAAIKRNRKFFINTIVDFDENYILDLYDNQDGFCFWYGIKMEISEISNYPLKPSLDRLDNNKGYTRDNIVLCSLMSNLGRNMCELKDWKFILENVKRRKNKRLIV
jgi:hypothetical protein